MNINALGWSEPEEGVAVADKPSRQEAISGQLLDKLKQLSAMYPGAVMSYVGGSRAQGYASTTSDVDLVVLIDCLDRIAPQEDGTQGGTAIVDGLDVDIEVLNLSVFTEVSCEGVSNFLGPLSGCSLNCFDPEAFSALRSGIPVAGERALRQLKSSLPWDSIHLHLLESLRRTFFERVRSAQGAIANGFAYSARWCSRAALDTAIDIVTVSSGELSIKPKWRMHRIERIGLYELGRKYFDSDTDASSHMADSLIRSQERLQLAEAIVSDKIIARG
ncbi:hypothetical protein [Mycobacteroides abscessus]